MGGAVYIGNNAVATLMDSSIDSASASSNAGNAFGGAMYLAQSAVVNIIRSTITNVSVVAVTSPWGAVGAWGAVGGAMYLRRNAIATLVNSTIDVASATSSSGYVEGGAIFIQTNASATLTNAIIANASAKSNSSTALGGAIALARNAVAMLIGSTIVNTSVGSNIETAMGGAMSLFPNASATLINSTVVCASARSIMANAAGGALFLFPNASAVLLYTTLTMVSATSDSGSVQGGAMQLSNNAKATLTASTIANASAKSDSGTVSGGAMSLFTNAVATLIYSTIVNASAFSNSGNVYGGAMELVDNAIANFTEGLIMRASAMSESGNTHGGGLFLSNAAQASLVSTQIQYCVAHSLQGRGEGGGAFVSGDARLILSRSAVLLENHASTDGSTMSVISAIAIYILPAPPGRWVAAHACLVNRRACLRGTHLEVIDPSCAAAESACSRFPRALNASVNGTACQPTLSYQQCNWFDFPHLIGQSMDTLPQGAMNVDYPYACSAGILGSEDSSHQNSSLCAGRAAAGTYQPHPTGTIAIACPRGSYCTPGSSRPLACPGGSYSSSLNLQASSECTTCPAGSACVAGSSTHTMCVPGTITATEGQSKCSPCSGGEYQEQIGSTACRRCIPGYFCAEGSATPLPCPGGTRKNTSLSVMTSINQCIVCPAGTSCSVGSALALPCLPGSVANQSAMETCSLCPAGEYQRAYGQTACEACTPGFYCREGAATPEPCPGGTSADVVGLYSPGQCINVPIGFWAPLGSRIPEPCPTSGFFCPGTLRDPLYHGAKPILMAIGQSTRQEEVPALTKAMTLDMSIDDFATERAAFKVQLAAQYDVHASLLTLEAAAGSLHLSITIATTNGTSSSVDIGTIRQSVAAVDDATLASTIGSVMGTTVNVVSQPATVTTVLVTVSFACPRGHWCTAGLVVPCPLNTYNPLEDQDFATACIRCPVDSGTRSANSTSRDQCVCNDRYYDANASHAVDRDLSIAMTAAGKGPTTMTAAVVTCAVCPVGVDCSERGSTLQSLPLSPGYYRLSTSSVDVRRCPDASAGCSTSQCAASTSGCVGGGAAFPCAANLTGTFCQLCEEPHGVYFVPASSTRVAHCAPCEDTLAATAAIALAFIAMAAVLVATVMMMWHCLPEIFKARLFYAYAAFTPQVKLKILVGFYMIATAVSRVYEVTFPDDTQALLDAISVFITFGIPVLLESTPLECLNLRGYTPELLFWACLPFGLVLLMLVISVVRLLVQRNELSISAVVLLAIRGGALQLLFLVYPILTNKAFEAFPCHEFNDGSAFLRVDVSIVCGGNTHAHAQVVAGTVMVLYPMGLLVGFRYLLYKARHDITSGKPSPLSEAIGFLHSEYRPALYWWELMEMLRRLILVGALVVFRQGSIEQVAFGTLFALVYSAIQMTAAPYRKFSDNFFASACSLLLSVLFLLCLLFKYAALTQLPTLNLTPEQREYTYAFDSLMFSGVLTVVCVSAFALLGVVFIFQAGDETRRMQREARAAKARRLRYVSTEDEVVLGAPRIPPCTKPRFEPTVDFGNVHDGRRLFHIFLSHVWGTGQDQMRIVKQRLLEMLPDAIPFLDVDDLRKGKGAEYVDASSLTLIFISEGYFSSENCMREILRAVVTGKPIITLMESEVGKGGVTQERVLQQLGDAAAPCEKNGAQYPSKFAMWKLTKEMTDWGYEMPGTDALYAAIFDKEPIEWNRIGAFQDVSLRLIAESILYPHVQVARLERLQSIRDGGADGDLTDGKNKLVVGSQRGKDQHTYLQGELSCLVPTLAAPRDGRIYHVYCSPHNAGALELMREVSAQFKQEITATEEATDLPACERMLVYLNGLTWTSGEASDAFAEEVLSAMNGRTSLLLCHEMPGVGGQAERHGCVFDVFFPNSLGVTSTPHELLQRNIYSQIATPLKGGAWRKVSMVMVAQALVGELESIHEIATDSIEGEANNGGVSAEPRQTQAASRKALVPTRHMEMAPSDGGVLDDRHARRSHHYDSGEHQGLREAPPRLQGLREAPPRLGKTSLARCASRKLQGLIGTQTHVRAAHCDPSSLKSTLPQSSPAVDPHAGLDDRHARRSHHYDSGEHQGLREAPPRLQGLREAPPRLGKTSLARCASRKLQGLIGTQTHVRAATWRPKQLEEHNARVARQLQAHRKAAGGRATQLHQASSAVDMHAGMETPATVPASSMPSMRVLPPPQVLPIAALAVDASSGNVIELFSTRLFDQPVGGQHEDEERPPRSKVARWWDLVRQEAHGDPEVYV